MRKIIIIFIIFIFVGINSIQAIYISPKIEKVYNNLVKKLEKNKKLEEKISIFSNLGKKIEKIKKYPKYRNNKKIINLLNQISELNKKHLLKLKKDLIILKLSPHLASPKGRGIDFKINYEKKYLSDIEKNKKIINSYSYSKYFKNKVYNKNFLILENGIWYTYFYENINYFPDDSKISYRDLKYNNINLNKDILFVREGNKLGFIRNPKKVRLISDYIISDIKNKYYLLKEIRDDFRIKQSGNYDKEYLKLKNFSKNLTYNLSRENKIKNIYNYILRNTKYSEKIDFKDYKIFSGIETFLNKNGVCEGYAKLMVYMLIFSGIEDAEVIRGYVIDAQDFPEVGHAWVKVGDKYYDPTFDDPNGASSDKNYNQYKYFGLPKDLFYTNRFDRDNLPESYKKLSMEDRQNIVQSNLFKLYNKYKNSDYRILKLIKIKKEHNINYQEKITLKNFSKILPLRVVNNFSFIENGKKIYIQKLKYYEIDGVDLEALLEQIDYNLDGKYFFLWYDENGNSSYRLGYDVEIR